MRRSRLPKWAIHETRLPHSCLEFLDEPAFNPGDGKGLVSWKDLMLRRQYEAALKRNRKALAWLLKRIARERAAELTAADDRGMLTIQGVPRIQPLSPVMAVLGCITVAEPEPFSDQAPQIRFEPWFEKALAAHCRPESLALVAKWIGDGGYQEPPDPEPDRCD
jgi:hypothetical protein